jgi:hypothetical protein
MLLMLFKINNVYLPFAKHSPYASDSAELRTIIGFEIITVRHLDASLPANSAGNSSLLPEISLLSSESSTHNLVRLVLLA